MNSTYDDYKLYKSYNWCAGADEWAKVRRVWESDRKIRSTFGNKMAVEHNLCKAFFLNKLRNLTG